MWPCGGTASAGRASPGLHDEPRSGGVDGSATTSAWPWPLRPPADLTPTTRWPPGPITSWPSTYGLRASTCRTRQLWPIPRHRHPPPPGPGLAQTAATTPTLNRVSDVFGAYLNPPERALVLSVGEKTTIQAKEHRDTDQAPAPGLPVSGSSNTPATLPQAWWRPWTCTAARCWPGPSKGATRPPSGLSLTPSRRPSRRDSPSTSFSTTVQPRRQGDQEVVR